MALSRFQNQHLHNQPQLDTVLLQLSRNLVPADEDLRDAKKVADNIFRTLQKNRRFRIDRLGIMGSVEKKTALASEFDLDCVIFVNNITIKDFPTVLQYFEQTLELEESISAVAFRVPKTKGVALQMTVDGFDFDIAPAINFSQDPIEQRDKVLAEIRKLAHPSKDGYRLSSSLIYDNVNFIKKQSPFAHDIIRLAKLWNRSVFIEEYISGRSTMIELIAVDAANKVERNYHYKSHVEAFRQFLHSMRDLKNVVITFDHRRMDSYISSQRPLVLDPINPYNNFAYDLKRKNDVRLQFEKFANITLQRLNAGNLFTLFLLQMNTKLSVRVSRKWIVGVYDNDESKRIKVIERNYEGNHHAAKVYKHFFSSNLKILKSDGKTKKQLKDDVKKSIDEFESDNREWVNSNESHEDRDVTFEMPSGDGRFLILCSCNL